MRGDLLPGPVDTVVESPEIAAANGPAAILRGAVAMDFLWPAMGIAAIVCFVFYVLASHWRGVLQHQSRNVRHLAERVRMLEELGDPEFRRRLGESAPVPLEHVFNFAFRMDERFWNENLHILREDRDFIRASGAFVGSLKLERWRSHTVATITEVLPECNTSRWQTRSLDFYPDTTKGYDSLVLWELRLTRPNGTAERPPSLELILRRDAIEMWGPRIASGESPHRIENVIGQGIVNGPDGGSSDGSGYGSGYGLGRSETDRTLYFRVPLDAGSLMEFRSNDPASVPENENGTFRPQAPSSNGHSWREFYSHRDEDFGIEWQLRLTDLNKKAEWERWNILDGMASPVIPSTEQERFFSRWRASHR